MNSTPTPKIEAKNLNLHVNGRTHPILDHVDFFMNPQSFVVVVGHNGSGKSTLTKVLAGIIRPTTGTVLVDSTPINKMDLITKSQDIIVLNQKVEDNLFLPLTLRENVCLWESRYPAKKRLSAASIFDLVGKKDYFLHHLDQVVDHFSGGEKQMILLALVLAHPPSILFLDEHTSALDPNASNQSMKMAASMIEKYHISAIMVTHDLRDAIEYGDRLVIMNNGRITHDYNKKNTPIPSLAFLEHAMAEA
jgi:putative ABC transport system ATP-binding protein